MTVYIFNKYIWAEVWPLTLLIIWHFKQSNGLENMWKFLTWIEHIARILLYAL